MLNLLTWNVCFSLINIVFWCFYCLLFCCKNSYITWLFPYLFGAVSPSELSERLLAGLRSSASLPIKYNSQLLCCAAFFFSFSQQVSGSQHEELHPWQRSWGRRLRHTQRQDRASGNPLFPSIYPQNQSLPALLFHALTYTSDFSGGWPPLPLSENKLTYSSKLIKIPERDKSVSIYELLWRLSSLPVQVCPATCDCLQPPNRERHEML